MIAENKTQKQQDDSNAQEAAETKRIGRLADDFAKRARERQVRYDQGHNIFTK